MFNSYWNKHIRYKELGNANVSVIVIFSTVIMPGKCMFTFFD